MTTVPAVNRALKAAGLPYEIVRGSGYFYFAALNDDASTGIPSLYTMTLRHDTAEGLVRHVSDAHAQHVQDVADRRLDGNPILRRMREAATIKPRSN